MKKIAFIFVGFFLYFLFKEQHVRQNDKTNLNTFDFYILHREANFFAGLEGTS
jgi:hypothetical protein